MFHVNIILDFPITYRNATVLCQSECACLHKTVNMVVFFVKSNENTYPKGTHANVHSCPYNEKREYMYLKVRQNKRTLLYSPRQFFWGGGLEGI